MGKSLEETCLQSRYTNGQEAHEKILNVISHQGSANSNHNEIQIHTP